MRANLRYPALLSLAAAIGFLVTRKIQNLGDGIGVAVCRAFNTENH